MGTLDEQNGIVDANFLQLQVGEERTQGREHFPHAAFAECSLYNLMLYIDLNFMGFHTPKIHPLLKKQAHLMLVYRLRRLTEATLKAQIVSVLLKQKEGGRIGHLYFSSGLLRE